MVKSGEYALSRAVQILVVDDEIEVRDLVRSVLSREGFAVSEAADGSTALKLIESGSFDLLITDIGLPPPLDGLEMVRRARAHSRELKSLFISGKCQPAWDDAERDDFVSKPFKSRDLVGCVWELLTRESSAAHEIGSNAELGLLEAEIRCLIQRRDDAIAAGDDRLTGALESNLLEAESAREQLIKNWQRSAH
jgi:DNA-binding response OmpR family regulator